MFTLQPYQSSDTPLLHGIFSKKEVARYTNRGGIKSYLYSAYIIRG